ncbi:hypothetical protein HJC23_004742 [Cyclotella cryptica]|uniref:Uncharacterized protein n=1 Tax=Cyclotella cryptica TaxID=29204 RepID=A0ABD3NWS9_9STRA|eukprot:CCRYP_019456-RA/>CCRYP_019456-RA protein AED:0.18 eAED:0.18 QI:0/-1/0/1/-1/1/1/0/328
MFIIPPASLLLLALYSRRHVLSVISSIKITNDILIMSPSSAVGYDDDSASPELYLARPLGLTAEDGREITRPSAPLEYLLPAARVGVYIYQTLAVAEDLAQCTASSESKADSRIQMKKLIEQLDDLFINPPSFVKSNDPAVTRGDPYKLPPVVGELVMQQQKQKERLLNSMDVGLIPQFFEVGELIGERRAWDRLSKTERMREEASEVRRAFNIYTTNLNFNTKRYTFRGSKEEKSRLIREDKLPTAGDVIRSDLDARDLYRNAAQTALEDAKAEFLYQKGKVGNDALEFDASELILLLKDAKRAVDSWFSFIPDEDVKKALEVVKNE